jgi:hypothetical protein
LGQPTNAANVHLMRPNVQRFGLKEVFVAACALALFSAALAAATTFPVGWHDRERATWFVASIAISGFLLGGFGGLVALWVIRRFGE